MTPASARRNLSFLRVYTHPRLIAIFLLGFVSGLPLALTGSTLGVWLTDVGVSLESIGLFAAVATPYSLKFLWSPLMDATLFPLLGPWLGRRRGWLIATQLALVATIFAMGLVDPRTDPWLMALMAFLVAVASASQDIVIDAYRVEILKPEEYGAGAATVVLGYRLGMIASAAGALFLASRVGWSGTYAIMAMLMLVGILTVLFGREPESSAAIPQARRRIDEWIKDAVIAPFADFMKREHAVAILLFILLYKLADAFMGVMTNPFLLKIGFTKDDIATVVKFYGLIATIAGSFIGGSMVYRLGIVRTLWICGIAHALTNLLFVAQANIGPDTQFLALSITMENVSGGMGTAAFVAFMSALCNVRFTATQYALLSSFAAFGRTWLSTPAGLCAKYLGWPGFFTLAAALAIPGLVTLWWLMRKMEISPRA